MKRDIFRRGVRMTHRFGTLENVHDPFSTGGFDPQFPERVSDLGKSGASPPLSIQQHGEHLYMESSSPVVKPTGEHASLNGPSPDYSQIFGMPVPVGSKRRLGPLKTDK